MRRLLALVSAAALAGCSPVARAPDWADVREITPAAIADLAAGEPSLACTPSGGVALTWVTHDSTGADAWIAISRDSGEHFGPAIRLNAKPGAVESYPESRPVVAWGPAGPLAVAWAAERDSDEYAADLVVRVSGDDGASFAAARMLNADAGDPRSPYHGFLALDVTPNGRVAAAWLDGRDSLLAPGETEPARASVRLAIAEPGGTRWRPDVRVAGDACSCCRVGVRADDEGRVAVIYRGARADHRDSRLALSRDGGATFALDTLVSDDRWILPGCPSIGPALTLDREGNGLLAWFTGSTQAPDGSPPGVYLARWRADGALPAGKLLLADSLREANHPMLAPFADGALAAVLARPRADSARAVLAVRAASPSGALTPWLFLGAKARAGAIVGTPGRLAYAAWVERSDDGPRVRVVRLTRR